jgi:predicted nucleic acid-binding protein
VTTTAAWLADTSVAVPAVLASHTAHEAVRRGIGDSVVVLAAHSALETYAVLTRLPGDARLTPADAAVLLDRRFGPCVVPSPARVQGMATELAGLGIAGGAAYDALIAITAAEAGLRLLTRDTRAAATYSRLNVPHDYLP